MSDYKKAWTYCRNTIQDGLSESNHNAFGVYANIPPSVTILRKKGICRTSIRINYSQYEDKIVTTFKVALVGWPISGRVCNPGDLSYYKLSTLRDALTRGKCKWVVLTPEEAAARTIDNWHRQANAEQVHGPPQEQA